MSVGYGCQKWAPDPLRAQFFLQVGLEWHLLGRQGRQGIGARNMRNRFPTSPTFSRTGEYVDRNGDIIELLSIDPGHFTLGELLQQRETARQEIIRLRGRYRQASEEPALNLKAPKGGTDDDSPPSALRPGMLVSAKELKSILSVSTTTLYKMVSEGRFPQQTHIGQRTARWRSDDVIKWLAQLRS